MPLTRSTPTLTKGFTLIELLIAAAIAIAVVASALSIVISSRRIYELDRVRTGVNQNLRTALDLVGADIRIMGVGLPPNFPAFVLTNNAAGDTLTLRRKLNVEGMTFCGISGNTIVVAIEGTTIAGCAPQNSNTANPLHDPLEAWQAYRTANGEQVRGYIYNYANQEGEFFTYTGESGNNAFTIAGTLANAYPAPTTSAPPTVALLLIEEHKYTLEAGLLNMYIDGSANPQGLVAGLSNFQVTINLVGNPTPVTVLSPSASYDWRQVARVNIELQGAGQGQGTNIQRTLQASFFPRNALSAQ